MVSAVVIDELEGSSSKVLCSTFEHAGVGKGLTEFCGQVKKRLSVLVTLLSS